MRIALSALFLCLAGALPAPAAEAPVPVVEEGFESPSDGLLEGWKDTSSGGAAVTAGTERRAARAGRRSWRLRATVPAGGRAAVTRGGIPLSAGESVAVELWLRCREGTLPVEVRLGPAAGETPYAARTLAVGPEWRRCVLTAKPAAADPAAALTVATAASGVLYLDALKVVQGELPAPREEAARKGNRLANAGFELGLTGWHGMKAAGAEGPGGERVARLAEGGSLSARPLTVRPDRAWTVSASVRGAAPGARAELSLSERGSDFRAAQEFPLTGEWRRVSFQAVLPAERSFDYTLMLRAAGGPVEVDAVQVEEGDLTEYAPAAPLEVAVALPPAARLPAVDEILTVPLRVSAPGKAAAGMAVRCRLEGFYGETLAVAQAPVPPESVSADVSLRVRIPTGGVMRLVAEGLVDGEPVSRDEAALAALPETVAAAGRPGTAVPFLSWGDEAGARAAARAAALALVQKAAAGAPLPEPGALLRDPAHRDPEGAPAASLGAAAAAVRLLGEAAPVGRVETPHLRAYLFRRGEDTVVALWAPGGGLPEAAEGPSPVLLRLKLLAQGTKAFNLMGNPRGVSADAETTTLPLRGEVTYLLLPGVPPTAAGAALKAAAAELAVPPAPKPGEGQPTEKEPAAGKG